MPGLHLPKPFSTVGTAWRGGIRAWQATTAIWFATAVMSPFMWFGFVWFLIMPFIAFANGTLIVVPFTITSFMLYTALLIHCFPGSFMGTPWSVTLGLVLSAASFLCVLVQTVVIWAGVFDGKAGVPYYTPMIYLELGDDFWPYLLLFLGQLGAGLAIIIAGGAFGASAWMYLFIWISNKLPNPGWIFSNVHGFTPKSMLDLLPVH